MELGLLRRYFYPVVGGVLLLISPYVVLYEGNTLLGVAFALLGLSLLADEWTGTSQETEGGE